MRKSIAMFIIVFIVFAGTLIFAEQQKEEGKIITDFQSVNGPIPEEEKQQQKELREALRWEEVNKFKHHLSKGGVGRFQAVQLNQAIIFILDTRMEYCWTWQYTGSKKGSLNYIEQVYPFINE